MVKKNNHEIINPEIIKHKYKLIKNKYEARILPFAVVFSFVIITAFSILAMLTLTSCNLDAGLLNSDSGNVTSQANPQNIDLDENVIIALNETAINETTTSVPEESQEAEELQNTNELQKNNELGKSQVEFYFLLKGRAYVRAVLAEGQSQSYNMSGTVFTLKPLIITQDRAKFMINSHIGEYTSKAIAEDEFDSTADFEIIVSNIYYRR